MRECTTIEYKNGGQEVPWLPVAIAGEFKSRLEAKEWFKKNRQNLHLSDPSTMIMNKVRTRLRIVQKTTIEEWIE